LGELQRVLATERIERHEVHEVAEVVVDRLRPIDLHAESVGGDCRRTASPCPFMWWTK
jgi:hypothetical protein